MTPEYVYVTGSPVVHVWLGAREIACGRKWAEVGICTGKAARRCKACEAYARGWRDRGKEEGLQP